MFFICELKKLRQLKASLLARFRCEKLLAALPGQLDSRIENCDEASALKLAEENLENAKKADTENRKKRIRKATVTAGIVSLIVSIILALLISLPPILVIVGGTVILTLIVHLIARSAIKNGGAKTQAEIHTCEEELALATEAFEAAKVRIETELQEEINHYENVLNTLNAMIKKNTVVHNSDKNYNTVCQIIWCFERKYARSVTEAKQWIARANHSKYVRARLDEIQFAPQDEADIDLDATEGNDYSEEIPQTTEAEA